MDTTLPPAPHDLPIRIAYGSWPHLQRQLRKTVAGLTEATLAHRAAPEGWPLWAIVGHLACQRVFWLCDFAGEPGKEATRFPDAAHDCPGDDDLEHVLSGGELAEALDATFAIVERCLDTWTVGSLGEVLRRPEWGEDWAKTRSGVIQRVYVHDATHVADVNAILAAAGQPGVDVWT